MPAASATSSLLHAFLRTCSRLSGLLNGTFVFVFKHVELNSHQYASPSAESLVCIFTDFLAKHMQGYPEGQDISIVLITSILDRVVDEIHIH